MNVQVSKALKKATEVLQSKLLIAQKLKQEMMELKSEFVNSTNPAEKDQLKPKLISKNKELQTAEAAAKKADIEFRRILSQEPEEVYDLLDHNIQEHIVRSFIRNTFKSI
jgi:hypothetical protein